MNAISKLQIAFEKVRNCLKTRISNFSIDEDEVRCKIILQSNERIYLNYNNYDQYSYVIHYSPDPLDRIIIDNYDENWNVSSKPNHQHNRYEKHGSSTIFTGNPVTDMKKLCDLV